MGGATRAGGTNCKGIPASAASLPPLPRGPGGGRAPYLGCSQAGSAKGPMGLSTRTSSAVREAAPAGLEGGGAAQRPDAEGRGLPHSAIYKDGGRGEEPA